MNAVTSSSPWMLLLGVALTACGTSAAPSDAGNDAPANDAPANDAASADASTTDVPSTDAPSTDASSTDAGTDAGTVAPIVASPGVWTWIPIEGAQCADGSPTGIGINLSPAGSHTLEIYLEGGGACWDATTCYGAMPTAANLTGYDGARFASETRLTNDPLFHREYDTNPLRDATMVYVPYCTGDVHIGDRVASYTVNGTARMLHHVGAHNLDLAFARLHATDPAIDHVVISGSSAGGFGAMFNWSRASSAFSPARIDVLDDSGQPVEGAAGLWDTWRSAWGVALPAGCADCSTSSSAWFEYLRAGHPNDHYGLLSFTADTVVPLYLGITTAQFTMELDAWATAADATQNARYIFVNAQGHVTLVDTVNVDAVLFPWLTAMMGDGSGWQSARY